MMREMRRKRMEVITPVKILGVLPPSPPRGTPDVVSCK
jgi:hypothetical protein